MLSDHNITYTMQLTVASLKAPLTLPIQDATTQERLQEVGTALWSELSKTCGGIQQCGLLTVRVPLYGVDTMNQGKARARRVSGVWSEA